MLVIHSTEGTYKYLEWEVEQLVVKCKLCSEKIVIQISF